MKGVKTINEANQKIILFDCKKCYRPSDRYTARDLNLISERSPLVVACEHCGHVNKITEIIE